MNKKQSHWPLIISLILIAGAGLSYFLFPQFKSEVDQLFKALTSGNRQRISDRVSEFGLWGPLFIILAMILQMFLIVVPSPLLIVVSVLAYGPVLGTLIAITAVYSAATVGYWIGRYLGEYTIYRLIGEKKEKQVEFHIRKYGFWAVVITRLSPLLSNDAISIVGGIVKMNYWKFIAATLAGITPLTLLIAWLGENSERLKKGLIWTSAISVVFFIAYIIYDRKKNPVHN